MAMWNDLLKGALSPLGINQDSMMGLRSLYDFGYGIGQRLQPQYWNIQPPLPAVNPNPPPMPAPQLSNPPWSYEEKPPVTRQPYNPAQVEPSLTGDVPPPPPTPAPYPQLSRGLPTYAESSQGLVKDDMMPPVDPNGWMSEEQLADYMYGGDTLRRLDDMQKQRRASMWIEMGQALLGAEPGRWDQAIAGVGSAAQNYGLRGTQMDQFRDSREDRARNIMYENARLDKLRSEINMDKLGKAQEVNGHSVQFDRRTGMYLIDGEIWKQPSEYAQWKKGTEDTEAADKKAADLWAAYDKKLAEYQEKLAEYQKMGPETVTLMKKQGKLVEPVKPSVPRPGGGDPGDTGGPDPGKRVPSAKAKAVRAKIQEFLDSGRLSPERAAQLNALDDETLAVQFGDLIQ